MANVVNLNQFRKKRRREEKDERAAKNRVTFGRTKAEKETAEKSEADRKRTLDGKKRDIHPDC